MKVKLTENGLEVTKEGPDDEPAYSGIISPPGTKVTYIIPVTGYTLPMAITIPTIEKEDEDS